MANRLKHELRATVLRALCEGCSIRATSRMTGVHPDSIGRAIRDFGTGRRNLVDERLRGLTLDHLEVDEIWTFVARKQARLTVDEKALRGDIGDVYLWSALDANAKLLVIRARHDRHTLPPEASTRESTSSVCGVSVYRKVSHPWMN